jgi:hypothetical protein
MGHLRFGETQSSPRPDDALTKMPEPEDGNPTRIHPSKLMRSACSRGTALPTSRWFDDRFQAGRNPGPVRDHADSMDSCRRARIETGVATVTRR